MQLSQVGTIGKKIMIKTKIIQKRHYANLKKICLIIETRKIILESFAQNFQKTSFGLTDLCAND